MRKKLTAELIGNITQHIHKGHFVEHACQMVGISKRTYYDWLERGERELNEIESLTSATAPGSAHTAHTTQDNGQPAAESNGQSEEAHPGAASLYVRFYTAIKTAEAKLIDSALTQIKAFSTERNSWEAWFRFLESRFPRYFRREVTVIHDDEMAERRYAEILAALRRPAQPVIEAEVKLIEASTTASDNG